MKSRRFRTLHLAANAGESRENTKILGFWFSRSRLFPAVLGTRDRKWTAATGERDRKRHGALPHAEVFKRWSSGLGHGPVR